MNAIVERGRRVPLHLPVRMRVFDPASSFIEHTWSLNVSGGGLCVESHQSVQRGTRVEVAIELPAPLRRYFGNHTVYRARVVVCRIEPVPEEPLARLGMRFVEEIPVGLGVV